MLRTLLLSLIVACLVQNINFCFVVAQEFDGFTEPFRKIELASDEAGAIAEMLVEEGELVEKDQPLARLDDRIQKIQVEIARQMVDNRSQLMVAQETYEKRVAIYRKVSQLRQEGHASEAEVIRADMELSIAKSRLLAAQEEATVRDLELKRAEIQLRRRTVTAPLSGFVSKIHRHQGEFLSPLNPELLSLVQVDQLIAKFNVPSELAQSFEVGKPYSLRVGNGRTILAIVHSIGVEVNAESETIEIKFVIENSDFGLRSGEKITLGI